MVLRLIKGIFLIIAFLTLASIVNSCTATSREESGIELSVPEGNYVLEEVLPEGSLLLSNQDKEIPTDVSREYVIWQNGNITSLTLPGDPLCQTGTYYKRPGMLPDGRLGFVKLCVKWLDRPVGQREEYTLVAFDLGTGEVEQIMTEPIYGETRLGNFTWNPDMTKGIMQEGSLDGTFYWVTPDGPEPMDVTITEGRRSWSFADTVTLWFSSEIDSTLDIPIGMADEPAWSPDGQKIAFMAASLKVMDYEGISRARVPFNMYLMNSETLEPVKVLENIASPNLLKWSPESDWLLLDGCMGWIQKCGLWVFEPETERLEFVASGDFWGADWVSSEEIVSSYCVEKDIVCKEYKLMQYNISEIVNR
jgi:hypothetical protein